MAGDRQEDEEDVVCLDESFFINDKYAPFSVYIYVFTSMCVYSLLL